MEDLKQNIEFNRLTILSKMISFNNNYAQYLLKSEEFKNKISYSKNHLFWTKDNRLRESGDIRIYGIKNSEPMDEVLDDLYLKPLLVSYLSIKAMLHNDKKIFEKWKLSFENVSEELIKSIKNLKSIPGEELKKLERLIGEIKKADGQTEIS